MLKYIRLKNFISHEDTNIRFSEGVNVFIGKNGSGKSSIIDAITYALYGEHERGNDSNIVRYNTQEGSVELTFDIQGRDFSVVRAFNNLGSLKYVTLKDNNHVIASGERKYEGEGVSKQISAILGLGYDSIKIATIIKQGELDAIIELKPREIKDLIDRCIGLDRLDNAYERLGKIIGEFNEKVKNEYGYNVEDLKRIEEELEDNIKKEKEIRLKLESLNKDLKEKEIIRKELQDKRDKLESLRRRYDEYHLKKNELERYLNNIKLQYYDNYISKSKIVKDGYIYLSNIKDKEIINKRYNEILELEKAHIRREELTKNLSKLNKEITNYESNINELDKKIKSYYILNDLEYDKHKVLTDLDIKREELNNLINNKGSLESKLNDYLTIKEKGICPTCDRPISTLDIDNKISNKSNELEEIKNKYFVLSREIKELEDLKNRILEYEHNKKILDTLNEQLHNTQHNYEERVNERNNIVKELEKYQNIQHIDKLEKEHLKKRIDYINKAEGWLNANNIASESDLKILENDLIDLKKKLDILNNMSKVELKDLAIDDYTRNIINKIMELEEEIKYYNQKEHEDILEEYKYLEEDIQRLKYEQGKLESRWEDTTKEIQRLDNVKNVLNDIERYLEFYNKIRDDIYRKVLPTLLRSWALDEISRLGSEYLSIFDMGLSNLNIKEEKNNVVINCYNRGRLLNIQSMSGGERVAISVALRFAIASLKGKYNTDFIILDEPTTHLDQERRNALVKLITKLAAYQGLIKQIIIITHDQEIFEDAEVDNIVKFEKIGGISRINIS